MSFILKKMLPGSLIFVAFALLLTGCPNGLFGNGEELTVFFDAAKEALPSYGDSTDRSLVPAPAVWSDGYPIYELYGVLEDETDVGIGYFNLYDSLAWVDACFSDCQNNGRSITAASYSAPVDVGMDDFTYDTYYLYEETDYTAQTFSRIDGGVSYLLAIIVNQKNSEDSRMVMQGVYSEDTGAVEIGFFMGNNTTGGLERVKAHAVGNTGTHRFQLRIIRDGFGYDHNILGAGYSQGEGYFLLQLADRSLDIADGKYYNIAAEATATELQALDDGGYADAAAAGDTAGYVSDFLTAFVASDVAVDVDAMDASDGWILPKP